MPPACSATRYRSPPARYAQLIDDVRNDVTRLPHSSSRRRVIDIDRKRHKACAYFRPFGRTSATKALRRIDANASIVSLVRTRLHQRMASYRFALERLVLMTPSPQAAQAEQALNRLQARDRALPPPAPSWRRERSLAAAD